jgi:type II secretory pathway pseudopilin PulG
MILGILAAVAAPKLLGTSSAASENGLKQTLAVVRDAIERHAAEHGGQLPGDSGTEADFKNDIAPYLRGSFPVCPVANEDDTVRVVGGTTAITGEATPSASWAYCSGTGQFICNSTAFTKSEPTVKYDAW